METLPFELLEEVVSHLVASTPTETTAAQVQEQRDDIFSVRLTNKCLAVATSRHFAVIMQARVWMLNVGSLNRLSILLSNLDVAKYTTSLHFKAYRFAFERDYEDIAFDDEHIELPYVSDVNVRFDQDVEARNTYICDKLPGQLTKIFERAKSLKELEITSGVLEIDRLDQEVLRYNDTRRRSMAFEQRRPDHVIRYTIADPLLCVQAALKSSHANERLEAFRLVHLSMNRSSQDHALSIPNDYVVCPKITRLTIDASYFTDAMVRLYCPQLESLDLLQFEKMESRKFRKLHEHVMPQAEISNMKAMLDSLARISITMTPQRFPWSGKSPPVHIRLSTLYSFIGYLARYGKPFKLDSLIIRKATFGGDESEYLDSQYAPVDDTGKRLDDFRDYKGLRIEALKLEDVHRTRYSPFQPVRRLNESEMQLLRGYVGTFEMCRTGQR